MTPGMPVRYLDSPAQSLSVLDGAFDMSIGMPWPAHEATMAVRLTIVKQDAVIKLQCVAPLQLVSFCGVAEVIPDAEVETETHRRMRGRDKSAVLAIPLCPVAQAPQVKIHRIAANKHYLLRAISQRKRFCLPASCAQLTHLPQCTLPDQESRQSIDLPLLRRYGQV